MTNSCENDVSITIASILASTLCRELGLQEPQAMQIADRMFREVSTAFAGETVAFYARPRRTLSARDEAIRAKWKGNNVRELMQEFSLSRCTIYRIVGKREGQA